MNKSLFPRKFLDKIKTPDDIKKRMNHLQNDSKNSLKIVFTNGCFDLLHKGHVTYLEQARFCGDYLIVALNSDASVKQLKGPTRPLNRLENRLEVLAALECVDFVTWFEDQTPLSLIQNLKPNVLVKGGDWKIEQIVGAPEVLSWGGEVKSLPYVEGHSTTQLIEQARQK